MAKRSKDDAGVFRATKISAGRCGNARCSSVHLSMYDSRGRLRAEALVPFATVELLHLDMVKSRDWRPGDPPLGSMLN